MRPKEIEVDDYKREKEEEDEPDERTMNELHEKKPMENQPNQMRSLQAPILWCVSQFERERKGGEEIG